MQIITWPPSQFKRKGCCYMKEIKEQKAWICPEDMKEVVYAICDLADGLCNSAYCFRAKGVLAHNKEMSAGENAIQFISDHYAVTGGALRLIAASANILGQMLVNEDLVIVGHDQLEKLMGGEEEQA